MSSSLAGEDPLDRQVRELRDAFRSGRVTADTEPGDYLSRNRYITFADGSIWFPNGLDGDITVGAAVRNGLRAVTFLGAIAGIVYAALEFYEGARSGLASLWFAVPLTAISGGLFAWLLRSHRAAVDRMEMGTLLLPNHLILLSHGRRLIFPKASLLRFEIRTVGTSNREHVLFAIHAQNGDERAQALTFRKGDAAVETLVHWLRS